MTAALVFISGDRKDDRVALGEEPLAIGRHPRRDLVLREDVVSRHQATLRFENGRYVLRDENSTNGTFVNDRKIEEQVLQHGDVIEFGLDGPVARLDWADRAATREVAKPTRPRRGRAPASPIAGAPSSPGGGSEEERLRCPTCNGRFRVPVRTLVAAGATFVFVDEAPLPERCPRCSAPLDGSRLEEMVP